MSDHTPMQTGEIIRELIDLTDGVVLIATDCQHGQGVSRAALVSAIRNYAQDLLVLSGDGTPGPTREAAPRLAVCPCTLVEPCSRNCTCANSVMSGGCARCCTYGSREQQLAAARHLSGDGTPGPAPEAAPEETARQLAQRWRQEAKEHESRFASDLLLLCAIELECALRAELARAPNPIERDRIWCTALNESGLTPFQMNQVTTRFNILRADAERPPQETTDV